MLMPCARRPEAHAPPRTPPARRQVNRPGLSLDVLAIRQLVDLTGQIMGLPRDLSQHPGGFVLTKGPLSRPVPIENASMPDRTVIQWDKCQGSPNLPYS